MSSTGAFQDFTSIATHNLDPALGLNAGNGIRTGAQYREGLRDGRSIWLGGRKIEDVTAEDGFRGGVDTLAALYDQQHSGSFRDSMTTLDADGVRISASYLAPTSKNELLHKRKNTEVWSEATLGYMGRFPDFCANLVVGLRNAAPYLAEFNSRLADNAGRYLDYCARNDLSLTHALNDQFFDRTKSANEQHDPDLILRVVSEDDTGIVVRGLKNLATLSPICDEALVYPNRPRTTDEVDQSIAFAIPMNAPGLHVICRDAYGAGRDSSRLPLSTRFDEIDATLIFQDVKVPWDRVFIYKNPALVSQLIGLINPPWSGYVTLIRLVAKLEAFVGVLELLCRYDGKAGYPPIAMRLGEIVRDVSVLKACLRAMEEDARMTDAGYLKPAASDAYRLFGVEASERAVQIMEDVAASALIPTGSEADCEIPEIGGLATSWFKGASPSAARQMRLMALAGDMTQSSFGARTQLYERFHMGPPDLIKQRLYRNTATEAWVHRIESFIDNF
ncbi:4-hydroxyphenylacetate 3-hydroxylase N-terminal domain-containing protein [Aureimonas altamirensis]|uniref:4-hydroxyphenylacetate 3-hydroxylase N-terminal domain-containing protein n=1 Tax=Aureimonas altamirensis TaxID=370622 RepID=UPI0025542CC6|nr:4-hydroxyphenylacetate 3-hydroxylase N-terminal domain-containing protein [Aureimonas altamirensis]